MILAAVRRICKAFLLQMIQVCSVATGRLPGTRRVVVYYAWPDFARKAKALAEALESHGIPTVVRSGTGFLARARVKFSPNLHIGFWNHFYPEYMPARYIFYNAEPLGLARWRDNEEWRFKMRGALQIWGYTRTDERYVANLGIPYHFVPFGYAPYYESVFKANTKHEVIAEDIDVLFVGLVTDRRRTVLDRIRETGVKLEVYTYERPLRGAELDRTIARARIVLSMFAVDDPATHVADFARLDHLLSNRRFVLHERLPEEAREAEFEQHVPSCAYDEIPERCVHFLQGHAERARLALVAYEWFKTRRRIADSVPADEVRALMQ